MLQLRYFSFNGEKIYIFFEIIVNSGIFKEPKLKKI